jgi:hypothetical protein
MNDILKEAIEYLRDYYLDWNDYIERFSFPRMDYYYLLINISSFYKMIDLSFYRLDEYKKDDSELNLFYVLISMPKKIGFGNSIYNNFKLIRKALDYNDMVLKEYKENQKTN